MNERILIVEDEAIVLLDIRSRLIGLGYNVVGTASTGEEAIVKANATRPDAILMDIGLKGNIDGISAAEEIRKTQDTPIIYLTANSDITTLQRAKITGPFGYVLKPFDERELRVTIEMALYKHRMDRDLYDARQWLKVTLRNIGEGVIASDDSGGVKFMNTAAETLTGWALKDAAGKDVYSIFRLEDIEKTPTCGNQASLVSKEGHRRPIDYMLIPIEDDWGRVMGTIAIFKDITEQKQAEKKLSMAEEQLCAITTLISDAIFTCDSRGRIKCANPAAASLIGMKAEAMAEKNLLDTGIFSEADARKIASLFEKALSTGIAGREVVSLSGKDGAVSARTIQAMALRAGQEPMLLVTITF